MRMKDSRCSASRPVPRAWRRASQRAQSQFREAAVCSIVTCGRVGMTINDPWRRRLLVALGRTLDFFSPLSHVDGCGNGGDQRGVASCGLLGQEQDDQLTEDHVAHQPDIAAALEMVQTDFAFDHAKQVLHIRPAEGHLQEQLQVCLRRGVGHEVFVFAGGPVPGHDQPVGAVGRTALAGQIHLGGLDLPDGGFDRLPREANGLPVLIDKGRAPAHHGADLLAGEFLP